MPARLRNTWIRHPQVRNLAIIVAVPLVSIGAYLSITSLAPERGYVEQVIDGQTVDVRLRDETVRVRLADLATTSDSGTGDERAVALEAKDSLADTLRVGKPVILDWEGTDESGYPVARLMTDQGELVTTDVTADETRGDAASDSDSAAGSGATPVD